MRVNIADLRVRLNNPPIVYADMAYELNEALNELELHRTTRRNFDTQLEANNAKLLAENNVQRDELERAQREIAELRSPKTEFTAWLERVHPEMIESITLNFRKKEN